MTRLPDGRLILFVSASFPEGTRLAADFHVLKAMGHSAEKVYSAWVKSVPKRFRRLSGDTRELRYIGLSDALVPHFAIEEDECPT